MIVPQKTAALPELALFPERITVVLVTVYDDLTLAPPPGSRTPLRLFRQGEVSDVVKKANLPLVPRKKANPTTPNRPKVIKKATLQPVADRWARIPPKTLLQKFSLNLKKATFVVVDRGSGAAAPGGLEGPLEQDFQNKLLDFSGPPAAPRSSCSFSKEREDRGAAGGGPHEELDHDELRIELPRELDVNYPHENQSRNRLCVHPLHRVVLLNLVQPVLLELVRRTDEVRTKELVSLCSRADHSRGEVVDALWLLLHNRGKPVEVCFDEPLRKLLQWMARWVLSLNVVDLLEQMRAAWSEQFGLTAYGGYIWGLENFLGNVDQRAAKDLARRFFLQKATEAVGDRRGNGMINFLFIDGSDC